MATLAVNASKTCTKVAKATLGQYVNIGTATGVHAGITVSDTDTSHYLGEEKPTPAVTLEKSTNGEDADTGTGPSVEFNAEVTWSYVVKNTGNVSLKNIVVSDDKLGEICKVATLAVNASKTCTKSGKATEGQYENTGTVVAYNGTTKVQDTDKSHYLGGEKPTPTIKIETATNGSDADTPTGPSISFRDAVKWTYVVTNTGNVALTNVKVTDDKAGAICTIGALTVGASKTCDKVTTAVEGQYANVGTTTGSYNGTTVQDSDPTHYIGGDKPAPTIQIETATNGNDADNPTGANITFGDAVTWTYVVSNIGNVDLTEVKVTDDKAGAICTIGALAVGETKSCDKVTTAVEGQYANVGTTTGKYDGKVVTDTDPTHYLGGDKPTATIDIETKTNGDDADNPTGPTLTVGDTVKWLYIVKNTGTVDLTDVKVVDSKAGAICTIGNLLAGASETCNKSSEAIEGQYSNIGTVTGKYKSTEVTDTDPTHYIGDKEVVTPPHANDDVKVGETGQPVTLDTLANDESTDSELNPKSVVLTHENAINDGKKLVVEGEGVWTVDPDTGNITFVPEARYTDDPTFVRYTVEDLNANVSNEAVERINYPQNKPIANDDNKVGERCNAVSFNVLTNDSDPENDIANETVNFVVFDGANGSDSDNDGDIDTLVVEDEGTWTVDNNGEVLYTPSNDCSANPSVIKYSVSDTATEVSNEATITVIYPDAEKSSLGNFVWFDADKNGKQDEGESGLEGVTVELYDANDELNATTVTDENGTYVFVNLDAGEYVVKFIVKDNYSLTVQKADDVLEALNSDANVESAKTESITLTEGEHNIDVDAGMYITPKPSLEVVKSTNGGNVANIIVGDQITWTYVVSNTGNSVLMNLVISDDKEGLITNCTGEGSLDLLAPTKSITCTKTGTAILGAYANEVSVEAKDPDDTVVSNTDSSSYVGNAEVVELGSVGDYVWLDADRNGIQESSEIALSEIAVRLFNENNKEVQSTKTDSSGHYLFQDVPVGKYFVRFSVPSAYTVTTKAAGTDKTKDSDSDLSGKTELFTLTVGENKTDIDMGIYPTLVNLGDKVWFDSNSNGIQDADELKGVENILVTLYDATGTVVSETTTRASGQYEFTNLVPSNYYIIFDVPSHYKVSPANQGTNDSADSDANKDTGKTELFTLLAGIDNKSIDMGLYQEASKVGDRVWYDTNKNGIQDSHENGIADVTVALYRVGEQSVIEETKTADSGIYLFDNVTPGEYYIKFTAPVGYTITDSGKGTDSTDSNADASGRTENFTLLSGTQNSTIDMGVYQNVVSFGDRVWLDVNHDGLQSVGEQGVRDINVTIISATSDFEKSMLTDENGNYLFTHISAGEYSVEFKNIPYGHLITQKDVNSNEDDLDDSDGFLEDEKVITEVTLLTPGKNDLSWDLGIYKTVNLPGKSLLGDLVWEDFNKNGIQDIGERGIENVEVTLFNNDTDEQVSSTKTDKNGLYEFAHLDPEFNYYLQFTIPTGYVVSPQDQDDDVIDSDVDSDGKTEVITLEADKINTTVDMGLYMEGSTIGDRVFFDELNGVSNGIQDEGEQGTYDVEVTLYDAQGAAVKNTRTNASGEYHFTNVTQGMYTIGFSDLPDGYIFTTANQGTNDELDSDVNANARTGTIVVNGTDNITSIDAGLKKIQVEVASNDVQQGASGDPVTIDVLANDSNNQDAFNPQTVEITSVLEGSTLSEDGKTLTVPNEGVWSVNVETGAISFTPNDGFINDPTPITYSVEDIYGNETSADVEVNYPPVAVDDEVNGEAGKQIVIFVLDNDNATSSPLDKASLRLIDPATGDEVETLVVTGEGTWSTNIDGSITFTPENGFINNPTPIQYIIKEISGDISKKAWIRIIYPDAVDDVEIIPVGQTGDTTVDVVSNDSNNTVSTTVTIGCDIAGVQTLTVANEGTWSAAENGTITFSPLAGFEGDPTDIQYTIGLVSGERSNCATVDIRHELLAVDDTATLNVGAITMINILENDSGILNPSTVKFVIPNVPVEGTTLSDDGRTLTVPNEGVWTVNDEGIVTFTAVDGFTSVPSVIYYTVENSNGTQSNTASITLTEGGVSIVANDDIGMADGGATVVINILDNDTGSINPSSVRFIDTNGNEVTTLVVPNEGTWTVTNNGVVTFTGTAGYTGTPTPVRYIVYNDTADVNNTALISIKGVCVCDPYEESIPAMGQLATILIVILTMLLTLLFLRDEKFVSVK